MLARYYNSSMINDAEVRYNLDWKLLYLVDNGFTVCHNTVEENPLFFVHYKKIVDIERARLSTYIDTLEPCGFFECFNNPSDYPLSHNLATGTYDSLFEILGDLTILDWFKGIGLDTCAEFHRQKYELYQRLGLCDQDSSLMNDIATKWRVTWNDLGEFASKADEYRFVYMHLYKRYCAYVLVNSDPDETIELGVPYEFFDDIFITPSWTETWPDENVCIAYELEMESRMPFLMQIIERALLPERVQRRHGVDIKRRNRGSHWRIVEGEVATIKKDQMVRCIQKIPQHIVPGDTKKYIIEDIEFMTVEEYERARNKNSDRRNEKRNAKPVFRYSHPRFLRDTLAHVIKKRGAENKWSTFAPTLDVCVSYLLHAYDIPEEHWPAQSTFPKPSKHV